MSAQDHVSLQVSMAAGTAGARPVVAVRGALAGAKIRELIQATFPAQLHFRLELWKKNAWFDDLKGSTEWDVTVEYDRISNRYSVERRHGQGLEAFGRFDSLDEAIRVVERPYTVGQIGRGDRGSQYYYSVRLEVAALQSSDLDALQAWMRGPGQGAMQRRRSLWSAVRSGFGTMVSRIIGGAHSTYEARSGVFTAG